MRRLLQILWIIQVKSNRGRTPKLGKGYSQAYRINPYNPLSYIALPIIILVGILMFGFVGFWKEVELVNPFKWN